MNDILVAGVDEAGRGPLAGPVCAAAVILDPSKPIDGLDDSKKLSESKRQRLEVEIKTHAIDWYVAWASVKEIDEINILHATMLAMQRAVKGLSIVPQHVRIDGNRLPTLSYPATAVVGGDALHVEISAASILAKQARDHYMICLAADFAQYGFEKHKGYPTKRHIEAMRVNGVTPHHRRSFAPVREMLSV